MGGKVSKSPTLSEGLHGVGGKKIQKVSNHHYGAACSFEKYSSNIYGV